MRLIYNLMKKRICGAIARDLNKKYLRIKNMHPGENEINILIRVWNLYLTKNEELIRAEDGEDKIIRLDIIKEQHDKGGQPGYEVEGLLKPASLFDLYQDILYIETEFGPSDGKMFLNALKIFVEVSKEYGLDFKKEYEEFERTLTFLKDMN